MTSTPCYYRTTALFSVCNIALHSSPFTLVSTLLTLLIDSLTPSSLSPYPYPYHISPLQDSIAHTTTRMQASDLLHRGLFSPTHLAAMEAVKSHLMMNFDGTLQPLTLRQRLLYPNRQALLEAKISRVRAKAKDIEEELEEMEVDDDNLKDIVLLRRYCTTLHCTALHYTALHLTTLHYTALHYTSLHYTILYCTALHLTTLHYTTLHCTTPHYTTLCCTALHLTTLHYTILHCTTPHYTTLCCTALYCTTLHYTALYCTALYCTAPS